MSWLILDQLKLQAGVGTTAELLKTENSYFFHNLFAKLRYFSAGMSGKHVHMCLISLKDYAPNLMAEVLVQLLDLVSKNIDKAMIYLDQSKILLALDMLITITAFVQEG